MTKEIWRSFYLMKTLQNGKQEHLYQYKRESGRNGDYKGLRMTNAFILCDLL